MRSVPTMECGDGIFRADNGSLGVFEAVTTPNKILSAGESGKTITNRGSVLDLTVVLPPPKPGLWFGFQKVQIDKDITITLPLGPPTQKIHGGVGATQGVTVKNNTDTEYGGMALYCDGVAWFVFRQNGTWAIT